MGRGREISCCDIYYGSSGGGYGGGGGVGEGPRSGGYPSQSNNKGQTPTGSYHDNNEWQGDKDIYDQSEVTQNDQLREFAYTFYGDILSRINQLLKSKYGEQAEVGAFKLIPREYFEGTMAVEHLLQIRKPEKSLY